MSDQAFPPGGYPSMPGEPAHQPARQGPPPPSVANAVKLMFLRAGLGLLGLLVTLATRGSLRDQLSRANPSSDMAQLDSLVNAAITIGLISGVVFIALYVLLALQVRRAKSWARIVTLVLAGLTILGTLASLTQPTPGLSRALGLVVLLVDVAIVVLLVRRPSAEYFRPAP